jgi:hypothetical protein
MVHMATGRVKPRDQECRSHGALLGEGRDKEDMASLLGRTDRL